MTKDDTKPPKIEYGLVGVEIGETKITHIDGKGGELMHRGYSIQDLIEHPYERVAYLLVEGRWPTDEEYQAFQNDLLRYRDLPDELLAFIGLLKTKPADVVLQTCISYIAGTGDYPDWSLIALGPSIVSAHGAIRNDRDVLPADPDLGIPADCLRRLRGREINAAETRIINEDFVLHADHGASASTTVARVAASAGTSPIRSIFAALSAFAGNRHGGAIAEVGKLLDTLSIDEIGPYVKKRNAAKQAVAGFGHRVYRVEDPRALSFKTSAEELSLIRGDTAMLAKIDALIQAMKPFERFGVAPNVDLYSAVVYRLLGLETDQFTGMFAAARLSGLVAQVREQASGPNEVISPQLHYVGPKLVDVAAKEE